MNPRDMNNNIRPEATPRPIPEDEGKPDREMIIQKDEILDLQITLEQTTSVEEFLKTI